MKAANKAEIMLMGIFLCCGIVNAQQSLRPMSVDVSATTGRIRSLQGVSGPPIPVLPGLPTLANQFESLGIDLVRTHDSYGPSEIDSHFCPGGCPNFPFPDVPLNYVDTANQNIIFPDPDADPDDPKSYNFAPTDHLIDAIRGVSAQVYFRVGRSQSALSDPPVDDPADPNSLNFDRYSNVLRHVVMHYVKGWDHGYIDAVRYWEIWNEPGLGQVFWGGTPEQYYAFYKAAALAIKSVDPALQVGGPTEANNYAAGAYREAFIAYCATNKLPLDFFSWHWYPLFTNDPRDYVTLSYDLRKILDHYGFTHTRLMLSEWGSSVVKKLPGLQLAAYIDTSMIYMQDSPVDKAMYYRGDGPPSGVFQADGSYTPAARALQAMGLMKRTPERLLATGGDENGMAIIAGRSPDHKLVQILISNFAGQFAGLPPAAVPVSDGFGDSYEEYLVKIPAPGIAGRLSVGTFDFPATRTVTHNDDGGYELTIEHLGPRRFRISRFAITENADGSSDLALVDTQTASGSTVTLEDTLVPPGVEFIVIERIDEQNGDPR